MLAFYEETQWYSTLFQFVIINDHSNITFFMSILTVITILKHQDALHEQNFGCYCLPPSCTLAGDPQLKKTIYDDDVFFPTEAINYVTYNAEQFKKTTTVCLFKFQSLIKILTVNLLIQSYSFHRIPLFSRCTNLCQLREILSFGCFILTNLVYLGLIGREMIFLLALGSSLISVRSSIFM